METKLACDATREGDMWRARLVRQGPHNIQTGEIVLMSPQVFKTKKDEALTACDVEKARIQGEDDSKVS